MKQFLVLIFVSYFAILTQTAEARHHGHHGWGADQSSSVPSGESSSSELPTCTDAHGHPIAVNNEQVLKWKTSTPNAYLDRGFITGTLVGLFNEKNGHLHLDVFIGQNGTGRGHESDIEVIYNESFGKVQGQLTPGMEVSACGDYITSTEQTGRYPPSPVGAILHWIHKSNNNRHASGFLMIDGKLYGQENASHHGGDFESLFSGFGAFWN